MPTISFACESCGARFDVDASLAGKSGRCRNCGERMPIPRESTLPAIGAEASQRARATAGSARAAATIAARPSGRPMNWIEAVNSQVGLAAISEDLLRPAFVSKRVADALKEDSAPHKLAYSLESIAAAPAVGPKAKPAGVVTRAYRGQIGMVQRIMRWLNDSAYLLSIPFLALILIGAVLHHRPLAIVGATGAVLLNIGRLVTGFLNLVAIPFKESPVQGVFFLIPPFTFIYLAQKWNKVRKPTMRVVEPAATIGLVVAAFLFLPWLSKGGHEKASLEERIKFEARALGDDMKAKVGEATRAVEDAAAKGNLRELGDEARKQLDRVRDSLPRGGDGGAPTGEPMPK